MKRILSCISFCAFLLCAGSGFAEIRPGAFTLSPFIGGYTFDGAQHIETAPVYGIRGGYDFTKNWGAEAVFDYAATDTTGSNGNNLNFYRYGADALYHFMPDQKLVPFIAAGFGGRTIDYSAAEISDRTHALFDYGAGLKYFITKNMALRGDIRHLIVFDNTQNNLEYGMGLTFLFGAEKPAPVPVAPPPPPPAPKPAPIPPPPPAPASTLSVTPGAIMQGDTATLSWSSENATNCEIQPNIGAVQPQGSMKITPSSDTVYNLTCTGAGGTTTSRGNIHVSVPPPPPAPKQEKVCILLKVEFDTNKADIKPKYHDEIGKVAEFMKQYPEANGVIEGHTDNVGGYEKNIKLSERRAASIRNYLIEKYGVAPERLTSKGYGYTKPIAGNKTKEGRQKNRRIEATFDCVIIKK